MSPEQATGDREVDPRSDVYALGCVLYEMLVGEPPHTGSSAQAVLAKILTDSPTPPQAIRSTVPPNVDGAIRKALEKLPADRFTGAQGFAKALADPGFRYGDSVETAGGTVAGSWNRLPIAGRHLAAIMFTDIVGYTALMQVDEETGRLSRKRHRQVLEKEIAEGEGDLLQYFGDGSLSIFPSAVQAVTAAVEIQRQFLTDPELPVRIGIHLGDVAYDEQGVYGNAVNIASRIESVTIAGGIFLSEKVFDEIKNKSSLSAVPAGSFELKNVADPLRLYAIANEGVRGPRSTSSTPTLLADAEFEPAPTPGPRGSSATAGFRLLPASMVVPGAALGVLPLVGRRQELAALRTLVEETESGHGRTAIIRGHRGVGKSRLAEAVAEEVEERGWTVAVGRAYPTERLRPYALFSDAFLPLLREHETRDGPALSADERGALAYLFPALGSPSVTPGAASGDPVEFQTWLFWNFAELLKRLATRKPLLVILEDIQWADESSLDLLHFVARFTVDEPILLVLPYTHAEDDLRPALGVVEQSLIRLNIAVRFHLEELSSMETEEVVRRAFRAESKQVAEFAPHLFQWTRGNPFYIDGVLRGLVESGQLVRDDTGWHGWEVAELSPPPSVTEAVMLRMGRLSPSARSVADLASVVGTRVSHELLGSMIELSDDDLLDTLDELQAHQILTESVADDTIVYDFGHPLVREILHDKLSVARARRMHGVVAETLERLYGDRAADHAGELAFHFTHARRFDQAAKAVRYLAIAGLDALSRHANREAAKSLQEALDRFDASTAHTEIITAVGVEALDEAGLVKALARARSRLGEFDTSIELLQRVLKTAEAADDQPELASLHRQLGLAFFWSDRLAEAESHYADGLAAAEAAQAPLAAARIRLAQGVCYQHTGRPAEARAAAEHALEVAESLQSIPLRARAHRALILIDTWSGELESVRHHGRRALALAEQSNELGVAFWSTWALAVVDGLTGRLAECQRGIEAANRISEELRSPNLRLWTAELSIEHAYATGRWDSGIEIGERAIALARSLNQRALLPRLLVWTSLIHLGRGSFERAGLLIDEAWDASGAETAHDTAFVDVHTVVPAHVGRAAYHLAAGEWDEAVRVGELGLAIADRSGYVVWGIHRLLPILGEAHLEARNLKEAQRTSERLRSQAEQMGHGLGLALASACEALLAWLGGDPERGIVLLRQAAEDLEAIPMLWEVARIRRQLAARLRDAGDRGGAIAELLRSHEIFTQLRADKELRKTREQLKELGTDPPPFEARDRLRSPE